MSDKPAIKTVLADKSARLLLLDGVVGVGEGLSGGRPCIKVLAAQTSEDLETRIAGIIGGTPYQIVVSGEFVAK